MKKHVEVPVVVTTEYKGVFFGFLPKGGDFTQTTLRLTQAQMCVYWTSQTHGVLGLASSGPESGSRVGPTVPAITLQKITSVIEATQDAAEAWQKSPWL